MKSRLVSHRSIRGLGGLALVTLVTAGCGGSDRASVTGTLLRHDGSPLVGAQVMARSEVDGNWASGITDADGRFELGTTQAGDGIPPGEYYVVIVEDLGEGGNPRPRTIAAKYQRRGASGLSLTVKPGQRTVLDATLDPP